MTSSIPRCDWCHGYSAQIAICGAPADYALVSIVTGHTVFRCLKHSFLTDSIFKEIPIEEYITRQVMES
jgi:hypothetical protein